jgi:hypothetical protein
VSMSYSASVYSERRVNVGPEARVMFPVAGFVLRVDADARHVAVVDSGQGPWSSYSTVDDGDRGEVDDDDDAGDGPLLQMVCCIILSPLLLPLLLLLLLLLPRERRSNIPCVLLDTHSVACVSLFPKEA